MYMYANDYAWHLWDVVVKCEHAKEYTVITNFTILHVAFLKCGVKGE